MQINPAIRAAEKAVVGALLRNTAKAHALGLTGQEFLMDDYRSIVLGVLHLTQDGSDVDLITLSNYLSSITPHDMVAPNPSVLDTLAKAEIPANIRPSVTLIKSNKARSELRSLGDSVKAWAEDPADVPAEIVTRVIDSLDTIRRGMGQTVVNYKHLSEIAPAVLQQYQDYVDGISHNIPSGFKEIDAMTSGGGAKGDVWLVGALSGQGKSAMALYMARHQALNGIPVLIVSREMAEEENFKRIHSSVSQVPMYLMRPHMRHELHERLKSTVGEVVSQPIWIDSDSIDMLTIERSITDAVENQGVGAVYVDYAQLLKANRKANRADEVAYCSRLLKEIAMKLKIWICLLAQYNRQAAYSGDIQNHSFGESGQLEKDASVILHLSLQKVEKGERPPKWREAFIHMGKGRNSPEQQIKYYFKGETFDFAPYPYED